MASIIADLLFVFVSMMIMVLSAWSFIRASSNNSSYGQMKEELQDFDEGRILLRPPNGNLLIGIFLAFIGAVGLVYFIENGLISYLPSTLFLMLATILYGVVSCYEGITSMMLDSISEFKSESLGEA